MVQGMFLRRGHDPIIADIEARIAKWTLMPVGNGEGLQVLVSAFIQGAARAAQPPVQQLHAVQMPVGNGGGGAASAGG